VRLLLVHEGPPICVFNAEKWKCKKCIYDKRGCSWLAEGLEVVVPPKDKSANKGKAKEVTEETGPLLRAHALKKRGV
jgi:hypothetical protein